MSGRRARGRSIGRWSGWAYDLVERAAMRW